MSDAEPKVRVRFAPSPTGYLHVGGARTALYNWLYTRGRKGTFILRIEDTDQVRSTPEAVQAILEGMTWLGLDWDEGPGKEGAFGPYYQTQRLSLYQEYIDRLLGDKKAYHCFCTPQELDEMRKAQEARKEAPRYDGRCHKLAPEEVERRRESGTPFVIRFKFPTTGQTVVHDLVRGDVNFDNALLDDLVIVKSDGFPTYNFAAVIDDHLMEITHVIRGDDHLSNTPRQIQIFAALGWKSPKYGHIPMILGADKTRLSKRHGATSVIDYKKMGYLTDAMVNYLARLGWGHGNQEIFTRDELVEKFSIKKVVKTPAVFDMDKLSWMNGMYIRKMVPDDYYALVQPLLREAYPASASLPDDQLKKIAVCLQDRIRLLPEIVPFTSFFFGEPAFNAEDVEKHLKTDAAKSLLPELAKRLEVLEKFEKAEIETVFRKLAEERSIKAADLIHPARVALTGSSQSPPLFDVVELLGKETTLKRLTGL